MQESTKSKIRGILLIFFFVYIFAWGISGCDAGKAQAKDISIVNKSEGFTLNKDIADGQWKVELPDGLKNYQIQIVSSEDGHPVRDGKKSIRFEIRDGDCSKSKTSSWSDCASDRSRTELTSFKTMTKGEYWWAWSVYLPKDYQSVYPVTLNLAQFHTTIGPGHPYFMFYNNTWNKSGDYIESGGGYHIENQMRVNYDNGYTGPSELLKQEQMLGLWSDMVVNVKFSHKDDGWFKIWANGKLVYEYHGATKVKKGSSIFHFGIYQSHQFNYDGVIPTQVVYFDEVRYSKKCKKLNIKKLGYSCKALKSQSTEIHTFGTITYSAEGLTKFQKKQKKIIEVLTVRIANKIAKEISNPNLKEIESWVNKKLTTMDWDDNLDKLKDRRPTQERLIKNGIKQFI